MRSSTTACQVSRSVSNWPGQAGRASSGRRPPPPPHQCPQQPSTRTDARPSTIRPSLPQERPSTTSPCGASTPHRQMFFRRVTLARAQRSVRPPSVAAPSKPAAAAFQPTQPYSCSRLSRLRTRLSSPACASSQKWPCLLPACVSCWHASFAKTPSLPNPAHRACVGGTA